MARENGYYKTPFGVSFFFIFTSVFLFILKKKTFIASLFGLFYLKSKSRMKSVDLFILVQKEFDGLYNIYILAYIHNIAKNKTKNTLKVFIRNRNEA